MLRSRQSVFAVEKPTPAVAAAQRSGCGAAGCLPALFAVGSLSPGTASTYPEPVCAPAAYPALGLHALFKPVVAAA